MDKDEAELAMILRTRLGGATALAEGAGEAKLVAFTSVSGRFGNAGQVDYAAANDGLAKLVVGHPGGLALDFSAWGEIGMAAPLAGAMRERGVDPMDPDAAAAQTVDLITGGATGEWVISGRLGDRAQAPPVASEVVDEVPGVSVVREVPVRLGVAWLDDHKMGSAGLLPGVVGMAVMAHAAHSLEPSLLIAGLSDVVFEKPVKVRGDDVKLLQVRADRGAVLDGTLLCDATLVGDAGLHHRARVRLGVQETASLADRPVPAWEPGPTSAEVYKRFFHGPSFQVLASSEVAQGAARAVSVPLGPALGRGLPDPWRTQAMAREFALQTAGAHCLFRKKAFALPIGCRDLRCLGAFTPGALVVATAWLGDETATEVTYDVALAVDGVHVEELLGLRFRKLNA